MVFAPPLALPLPTGRRPSARWIAIGLVSVLLHLMLLDLLPRWTLDAGDDAARDLPLNVRLMAPVQPAMDAPARAVPVRPETPRRPRPRAAPPREPVFVPEGSEPVPEVVVAPASPQGAADRSTDGTAAAALPPAVPDVVTAASPAPAPPPPAATPPASARLHYKVLYVDAKSINPLRYYGLGTIDWAVADGRYRSDLVASYDALLFRIDLLASHSEGSVTAAGLAPDRYTESPRKRSVVATNFNRDARQSITFSASSVSAPLEPGSQDRLSVLFQIGALLIADGLPATPSYRVTLPVAGVRGDVEPWVFEVLGGETIEAGGDRLATTHLRRAARAGSNDRTIDVWIAGGAGGYPAKVLYTEPNGSTVEMTLDRIGRID